MIGKLLENLHTEGVNGVRAGRTRSDIIKQIIGCPGVRLENIHDILKVRFHIAVPLADMVPQ